MKVLWTRFNDDITFTKPSTWFSLGLRGSGKSAFLEHVGMNYLEKDAVILDLFGSRDGEGLAWLRSPYAKDKKILLLKGENVDVKGSYPVKTVAQLSLKDLENNDIIISSSPLYLNMDQEFFDAARITDLIYKRLYYNRMIYSIVREAANFYYSRLKVSDNQVFAKSQMIYLIREARHVGLSIGIDSIRYYAIDIDIRNLSDYLILKSQGVQGLDNTLDWLYMFFNPATIRFMQPQYFAIISKTGALGLGTFQYHDWHKKEKENIVANVGLKVEYGEILQEAEYRGTFKTVGDTEHVEIISLYVNERQSMAEVAEKLKRSSKTIMDHIHDHNQAVERSGFCPICRRARSSLETQRAMRERKER